MEIDDDRRWWNTLNPFHPCIEMRINRIVREVKKANLNPERQAFDFEMQRFYLRLQRNKRVG